MFLRPMAGSSGLMLAEDKQVEMSLKSLKEHLKENWFKSKPEKVEYARYDNMSTINCSIKLFDKLQSICLREVFYL